MKPVHVGCSGWNYRDWRGRFYPKEVAAKDWSQDLEAAGDAVVWVG